MVIRGGSVPRRNMNFFRLIRMCALCTVLFGFVGNAEGSVIMSDPVRDIRFSNFSMSFPNKSVGTVLECGIRTLHNKQMLYLRYKLHERLTDIQGIVVVDKCKEYFIDCENVVSYNITDGCSKLKDFTYFALIENKFKNVERCPLYGEYDYNNFTINAEQFGASFSYPFERWWDRYWKVVTHMYGGEDQSVIFTSSIHFYFLTYRIH